ncbi:rhamnan synthesis F family protein [Aquicoccus sp. G2-2]|uniref:rhamnan synthesis F family protein n=1 Tax=Aquicoccus sp. G2-2 TaxID=3092120 RepID=UPI002AE07D0E|nr:rhamnan synthesis F family protein [Aquicoccus sp. G2-2]MEA1114514.1 rhamnan synthesis F family protein [Aquicoccus sp. G2-2]
MGTFNLSKLNRELRRVGASMNRAFTRRFHEPRRQRIHDRERSKRLQIIPGPQALESKLAIFVLYQPDGLAVSVFFTLRHLASEGYATDVVINGPVSEDDLCRLRLLSRRVLLRPNIGYDFGAYRDALLTLFDEQVNPDHLLLLNDSTWFPLRPNDSSIAHMEALGVDLAGQVFKTEYATRSRHDHLEAHCLLVSRDLFTGADFRAFWRGYVMSDDRTTTVETGEKGLTQAMLKGGHAVGALLDKERFLALLDEQDESAFDELLSHLVLHRDDARAQWQVIRQTPHPQRRADALAWIDHALSNARQYLISSTFIEPAMRLAALPFIKKTSDPRYQLARRHILAAEKEGRIPRSHRK